MPGYLPGVDAFESALDAAGGPYAPASATAQLKALLADALDHGRKELTKARSGYDGPVTVAIAETRLGLVAAAPVDAALRADPEVATAREWAIVASLISALTTVSDAAAPTQPHDLVLQAGALEHDLVLRFAPGTDAELAVLAFDEHVATANRLRARALHVPAALLDGITTKHPIGAGHPLRVAEAIARLGGDPADPDAADTLEDTLATVLGTEAAHSRPHEDPDPASRVARRILQRLSGMGKWGGFHTDFSHLPRGFQGNDRALAIEVGEALLQAGLLAEKPSVGQRHVYLNPRRAGEIHRMIDTGDRPPGLKLPPA
jgi:hypothetical protein